MKSWLGCKDSDGNYAAPIVYFFLLAKKRSFKLHLEKLYMHMQQALWYMAGS